jgi:glycosyltransferase involved in cell wall biosynthesis
MGLGDSQVRERHMTTVSVIVPSYNHARYLNKRIGSILEQTYRDF